MAYKRTCSYEIIRTSLFCFVIRGSYVAILELIQVLHRSFEGTAFGFPEIDPKERMKRAFQAEWLMLTSVRCTEVRTKKVHV